MSLKESRKRLNKDSLEKNESIFNKSVISNKSRPPRDISTNISKNDVKNKKTFLNSVNEKESHKKNIQIEKDNDYYYDDYDNKEKKDKKFGIGKIFALVSVEIVTLAIICVVGIIIRRNSQNGVQSFTPKQNENITEQQLENMKGFMTVAIFGLDSRDGSLGKGNNSDVIMISTINYETGEIKLVSVYRDTYLNIIKPNSFTKINSAYMHGGPENAIDSLNYNLDLNIQNYFSFNWKAVADGIDYLGGIDLEITKNEYLYMNAFIHETCVKTGISAENPAAMYIEFPGYQHLNGVQAVAYGRLRLMDSDVQRVKRQKKVIELALQKAKQTDISILLQIVSSILPQVAYSFDIGDLFNLVRNIKGFNIVETTAFPVKILDEKMGSSGDCIIPNTLVANVQLLHNLLYGTENYTVSSKVRNYSGGIMERYQNFREENKIAQSSKEESKRESEKEKSKPVNNSIVDESNNSKPISKNASSSNTNKNNNTNNSDLDPNNASPKGDKESSAVTPDIVPKIDETKDAIISTDPPGTNKETTTKSTKESTSNKESSSNQNDAKTPIVSKDGPMSSNETTVSGPKVNNNETTTISAPISVDAPGRVSPIETSPLSPH
ncbi:MAG: LCP family protein [Eubacteriales bacterium]|nr:LCP family protein [Eubacteriales bacterium]